MATIEMNDTKLVKNLRFADEAGSSLDRIGDGKGKATISVSDEYDNEERIDMPRGFEAAGNQKILRQRTQNVRYTRPISSRVHKQRDIVWQENPDRVLKYRASHLHYYGWIPFLRRRNIKATVFANNRLHIQTLTLLVWMAIIHWTGLGLTKADLESFVTLFSMSFGGALFNLGTVVVFILGLFISLVINRWWAIRMAYVNLSSNTVDLSMMIANAIRNECDWNCPDTQRARSELTRLLNLGHLLVITQADGESKHFKECSTFNLSFSCLMGGMKTTLRTLLGMQDPRSVPRSPTSRTWAKKARDIDFNDLAQEGLVNGDEWQAIKAAELTGLPNHLCVYYWAQALIYKCRGAGWIVSGHQILPLMLAKISSIVEASDHIFTNISSQMPYPYVHLVSFVVHFYLVTLASWFGSFLFVGDFHEQFSANLRGEKSSINKPATIAWCYVLMAVANAVFQGLLDMHSLLDNPFGSHCAKFPLRAQVTEIINTTRTLLSHADVMPAAFRDVFQIRTQTRTSPTSSHQSLDGNKSHDMSGSNCQFVNFLDPPSHQENAPKAASAHLMAELEPSRSPSLGDHNFQGSNQPSGKFGDNHQSLGAPKTVPTIPQIKESSTFCRKCLSMTSLQQESVASLRRGVSIHNELVFGNLEPKIALGGDAALQELYLQTSVMSALDASEGTSRP